MPGTCDKLSSILNELPNYKRGHNFDVCSNPEFLREGLAIEDYFNPPYNLVGSQNKKTQQIMSKMYKDLKSEFVVTSVNIAGSSKAISL